MATTKNILDRLDKALLDIDDAHDEAMLLEELDGFLAGVIVCPELIMPSGWMPYLWSVAGDGSNDPVFTDPDHFNAVMGLIMEHYNNIAKSLLPGMSLYEPLFSIDDNSNEVLWELWSAGFSRAMAISPHSWFTIVESGDMDAVNALSGLRSLIAIDRRESKLSNSEKDRLTREAPDLIPEWVEILSHWRLSRNPMVASPASVIFKNTGRNSLCPCGSGKKYKKCHGAN